MSNPNEGQWNGQTGQPNQSQPSQPNPAGQPGQPQYGAYDSNHGGQYPPQGAPGAQDTQNQQAQNGQPQGGPNQNPYYGPYAYNPNYGPNGQPAWGPDGQPGNQNQSGWQQTSWVAGNFNPFRLMEEFLPEKAKTKIRVIYGVVGVAAIALGAALLLVPNKTLSLAALLLGVYFVISGVVRIVSALVESGGAVPAGRLACAGCVRRYSADLWRRGGCAQLRHDRSDAGITHYFDGRFRMDYGRRAVAG